MQYMQIFLLQQKCFCFMKTASITTVNITLGIYEIIFFLSCPHIFQLNLPNTLLFLVVISCKISSSTSLFQQRTSEKVFHRLFLCPTVTFCRVGWISPFCQCIFLAHPTAVLSQLRHFHLAQVVPFPGGSSYAAIFIFVVVSEDHLAWLRKLLLDLR